ncbi:transglycosylase domain-containing protein [Alicyclobacillus sp. SO9]|nr:transglycosylase domain-containing protein [Alicyclobacillus sp. SO9]
MKPIIEHAVQARIAKYHIQPLTYKEIPKFFRDAVISTEDRRFQTDPGIDPIGIARSLFVDIQKDGYVEGGSTITQQLVDNTILNHKKTIRRKVLQMLDAIGIYDTMSKKQTFQDYVNVIYYGNGAYGLKNAAKTYFGKSVNQLSKGELSMLAGLPNSPFYYDPFHHYRLARARQKIVLENMEDAGRLSKQKAKQVFQEPIQLVTQKG